MENVQIVSITETIWLDYSLSFCKLALMFTSKSANFCIFSLAVFFKWVGLHDKGFCLQAKFIWCFSQRLYIGIYSCPLLFHFLCLKWTYSAFVLRVKFQLLYRHWPFFFLPFLHFFTPFYQRLLLFKELSKIFKDFWRKFKDFSRISHNFPIFNDFSRPVRTMISANQHFTSTFSMQIFKFQRHSCKLSFLFPPRCQSAPESLLVGYAFAYIQGDMSHLTGLHV